MYGEANAWEISETVFNVWLKKHASEISETVLMYGETECFGIS